MLIKEKPWTIKNKVYNLPALQISHLFIISPGVTVRKNPTCHSQGMRIFFGAYLQTEAIGVHFSGINLLGELNEKASHWGP